MWAPKPQEDLQSRQKLQKEEASLGKKKKKKKKGTILEECPSTPQSNKYRS